MRSNVHKTGESLDSPCKNHVLHRGWINLFKTQKPPREEQQTSQLSRLWENEMFSEFKCWIFCWIFCCF